MQDSLNIRYIYHSSFSLEFEDKIIIFDYFQGTLPKNVNDKKVIFVVTHSHADHYNESIFDYENASDVTYIVSEDVYEDVFDYDTKGNVVFLGEDNIELLKKHFDKNVVKLEVGESVSVYGVDFTAYGSTDMGISVYFETNHLKFFFAGDLNNWAWEEDTEEDRKSMQDRFSKEIDKLGNLDIGFFPVDPRLKKNYDLGVNEFVEKCHPKVLFPMHFTQNPAIVDEFIDTHDYEDTKIVNMKKEHDTFQIIIK
ncbi:MBL fold metallo-hydrolase [uncultured Finegoldia sp.]|uniref:MBL fold metallo-hydrolase n=1 Tax=uncultured Finegoldia sp. TaxID=328009 RepID=UPI0026367333|nr:MBL fold metallo-hydrolase [uncultured Finegoldia sp.]